MRLMNKKNVLWWLFHTFILCAFCLLNKLVRGCETNCDVSRYTVPVLHGWFKSFDMVSSLYCVFVIDGPFNLLLENICPIKWRWCPSFKWHSLKQYAAQSVYYMYYWSGFHWESSVLSYYRSAFKVRNCVTEHSRSSWTISWWCTIFIHWKHYAF